MPPSRVEAPFSLDLGAQTFCRPMAAPDQMFLPWASMMLTGWFRGHHVLSLGIEPLEAKSKSWLCLLLPGKEGWDSNLMSEELFLAWEPCGGWSAATTARPLQ